jgi:hypothetical protein
MNRTKAVMGALVVCALSIGAFNAVNASASTIEFCAAAGAGGGTGLRWNAACNKSEASGPNETYKLAAGTPYAAAITNTSIHVISSAVAGVKITISCTGFEGVETTFENVETVEGEVKGSGKAQFTGCSVTAPSGGVCTVPEKLETVPLSLSAKGTSTGIKYAPVSGEKIITVAVGGAGCPAVLKGEKEIKGSATSVESTMVSQEFTTTSSSLTFAGQAATLTGVYHARVAATGDLLGVVGTP